MVFFFNHVLPIVHGGKKLVLIAWSLHGRIKRIGFYFLHLVKLVKMYLTFQTIAESRTYISKDVRSDQSSSQPFTP